MKHVKSILCLLILFGGFQMFAQSTSECLQKLKADKKFKVIVEEKIEQHKECSDILYKHITSLDEEDIKAMKEDINVVIKSYKKLYDYYKEEGLGQDKKDCKKNSDELKKLIKNEE